MSAPHPVFSAGMDWDIDTAIAAGRYDNKIPYRLDDVPVDEDAMTVRQAREHKEEQARKRREQRDLYAREEQRLVALFKDDLEKAHGVAGHPKADKLFEMAWSDGHSEGVQQVANRYSELVELIT